jgi:Putative beta barrel porin-7 (BBP7)
MFASTSGPYGIFAMPANEGAFSQTHFAVVPEVQVKVGYNITPSIAITVGYDFLYDSNVIRPGDQINRNIPKGQTFQQDGTAASLTSPARLFRTTDFYAQGISIGLVFRL